MTYTRRWLGVLAVGLWITVSAEAWAADGDASDEAKPSTSTSTSLMEAAPELLTILRRKPDYYGSPWSRTGGLLDRSALTGGWGGSRDSLVEKGIYVDVGVTQVLQAGLQGGLSDKRGPRYRGSSDYYLTIDTDKLGLWPGGLINMNGESVFGESAGDQIGSALPANMDGLFPDPAGGQANTTLSELYVVQALSEKLVVVLGKINALGLGDTNAYANNERTQFMNLGLNFNPINGAFVPYTPLALSVIYTPLSNVQVTTGVLDSEAKAGTAGFDTLFTKGTSVSQEWDLTFHPLDQRGTYRLGFIYTDKQVSTFDVDRRTFLGRLLGLIPPNDRDDNWVVYGNFDQAFWTADAKTNRSIGVFFRIGFAPEDRNVIDQFYSTGIGGYGVVPGRAYDRFGVGWYYLHLSNDFESLLDDLAGANPSDEQGLEIFYNFELTPAAHLTADLQFIFNPLLTRGPLASDVDNDDLAIAGGLRLQLDF